MSALLSCKNLSKKRDHFMLDGISFDIEPGYIMGVIGRNGCGKTTLLQTLMGSLRLDWEKDRIKEIDRTRTDIRMDGISILEDIRAYKSQFAYVLNDTPFPKGKSALEIGRIFGAYYDSFDQEQYQIYLKDFEVPHRQALVKLSAGQKIRQQLAFALSYDAKVYFFDEPTGSLDVEFRDMFYQEIRKIVAEGNKSVVYASHLVEEMEEFADYLLWMRKPEDDSNRGTQQYFGTIESLRSRYRIVDAVSDRIPREWIVGGRKTEYSQELLVCLPENDGVDALVPMDGKREEGFGTPKKREQENKNGLIQEITSQGRCADLREIMYYVEKGVIV